MIALIAACTSGGVGRSPDPEDRAREVVIDSEDGRWRLHLRCLSLSPPPVPGEGARLTLWGRLDLGDEDRILADRDPLVSVQRELGSDYRAMTPHRVNVDPATGVFRIRDLDVGPTAESLARIVFECRVIVVRAWKLWGYSDLGTIRRDGLSADPFTLTVTGERHNVWVAASQIDPPVDLREEDDLSRLLGHRWAANSAILFDAAARRLHAWGGSGTAGGTVIGYGAPVDKTPFEIAYPVSLELQVPHQYDVVTVRFLADGLRLPVTDR